MFVVHTVNQLEEAIRVGADEILVTGGLVGNVHEAYQLKSCKDKSFNQEDPAVDDESCNIDLVAEKVGLPVWGISSLMMITSDYSLLHSHLDPYSPRIILQRMS